MTSHRVWAGVDVGGRRKGFHAAVIDDHGVVRPPEQILAPAAVVAWLLREGPWPALVGVDSPCALALDDGRRRDDERRVAREVCGIRYTPSPETLARQRRKPGQAGRYYEWIEQGLALYDVLAKVGLTAIECFPTASWTCWHGPRGAVRRTEWSSRALGGLGLRAVPSGLGQDGRDAIGAAATARDHDRGWTETFGDIVVPKRRPRRAGST